ncbi:MAG: pilus assembly protein [Candidatus Dadabacteria bacterium]|nr:MAG: pilus assembly protein [Candidatus Dadabacteria bacterium]
MITKTYESGSVLVELAIIIPLVVMFFYGGFEYSQLIQRQHTLVSISRQLGASALRLCGSRPPGTEPGGTVECLRNRIISETAGQVAQILPGVRFVVTVVRWEDNPSTPSPGAYIQNPLDVAAYPEGTSGEISRETFFPDYPTPGKLAKLLRDHKVLVYAEVFYRNEPIIAKIPLLANSLNRSMYAVSIF